MGATKLSRAVFGLALICFVLPWVNVSCQGQKIVSLTGIEMATGKTIDAPSMSGQKQQQKIKGSWLAIITLLTAIAGFGVSFINNKEGAVASATIGAIGVLFLLLLKVRIDDEVFKQTQGMLQLNYEVGFYLALLSFLGGAGANVYAVVEYKKLLPLINSTRGSRSAIFCTKCGSRNDQGDRFCKECGTKIV